MRVLVFAESSTEASLWASRHGFGPADIDFVVNGDWLRGRSTLEQARVTLEGFAGRSDRVEILERLVVTDLTRQDGQTLQATLDLIAAGRMSAAEAARAAAQAARELRLAGVRIA